MSSQSVPPSAESIAGLVDHTLLRADATPADIEQLCDEALEFHLGAVCVNPSYISYARRRLGEARVAIVSVVGFPLGATLAAVKAEEAAAAFARGATEVDMMMHIGLFRSGDPGYLEREIQSVLARRPPRALVKVILETSMLTDAEKVSAALLVRSAGADFVKTGSGFAGPVGHATAADVALLRRTVGAGFGVKAAGGIRDLATLEALVAAGANRIGTSASVAIVREALASGR